MESELNQIEFYCRISENQSEFSYNQKIYESHCQMNQEYLSHLNELKELLSDSCDCLWSSEVVHLISLISYKMNALLETNRILQSHFQNNFDLIDKTFKETNKKFHESIDKIHRLNSGKQCNSDQSEQLSNCDIDIDDEISQNLSIYSDSTCTDKDTQTKTQVLSLDDYISNKPGRNEHLASDETRHCSGSYTARFSTYSQMTYRYSRNDHDELPNIDVKDRFAGTQSSNQFDQEQYQQSEPTVIKFQDGKDAQEFEKIMSQL